MLLAVIPPPHYGPLLREQTGPGPAATRPWGWPCTAPVTAVLGYQLPFPDRHSPRGEEVGQGTRCSPPPGSARCRCRGARPYALPAPGPAARATSGSAPLEKPAAYVNQVRMQKLCI